MKKRERTGRGASFAGAITAVLMVAALALNLTAMGRPPRSDAGSPPVPDRVRVVFVADGDTVRVASDGRSEWVRMLRIDTPEKNERGYGSARDALAAMIGGKVVRLVFEEEGIIERDDYGRLLAYVFHDGKNINVEMVRAGWSPFWTRYGEGRFAREMRRAERSARTKGLGLWK